MYKFQGAEHSRCLNKNCINICVIRQSILHRAQCVMKKTTAGHQISSLLVRILGLLEQKRGETTGINNELSLEGLSLSVAPFVRWYHFTYIYLLSTTIFVFLIASPSCLCCGSTDLISDVGLILSFLQPTGLLRTNFKINKTISFWSVSCFGHTMTVRFQFFLSYTEQFNGFVRAASL